MHKTELPFPPMVLMQFKCYIAVGFGKALGIYLIGKERLFNHFLELRAAPTEIVTLHNQGNRIVVGDSQQGITMFSFKSEDNSLLLVADDTTRPGTICSTMVDYQTVAAGDRFGNLWIVRCPDKTSTCGDQKDREDPSEQVRDGRYKMDLKAHFYVHDIPMSIKKTALTTDGEKILVWSGSQGTIGALIPVTTEKDVTFFGDLQYIMRSFDFPLAGRNHAGFRSNHEPVKDVIDGDMCERFLRLSSNEKEKIAMFMELEVTEIEKKIKVCLFTDDAAQRWLSLTSMFRTYDSDQLFEGSQQALANGIESENTNKIQD